MMLACSQCFLSLLQILVMSLGFVIPAILNFTKVFKKNLKKPLDIDDT